MALRHNATTLPNSADPDDLIRDLAERWVSYRDTAAAYRAARDSHPQGATARGWLETMSEAFDVRQDILRDAILILPANGPIGAAVQLELLSGIFDLGAPDLRTTDRWSILRYERMVASAFASIGAVLARSVAAAGGAPVEGLAERPSTVNCHVADVRAFTAAMIDHLAALDMDATTGTGAAPERHTGQSEAATTFIADALRLGPAPTGAPNLAQLGAQLDSAREAQEALSRASDAAYLPAHERVSALEAEIASRSAGSLAELVIRLRLFARLAVEHSICPDLGAMGASLVADAERLAAGEPGSATNPTPAAEEVAP